ncbi:MAG: flippase-like domain-containing protein [Bacteroidales bacterium]|nr:flippase-like domain-containing protein [Bacteroidales bacterium]
MKKKLTSFIKISIALGLGLIVIWLSVRNVTPEQEVSIFNSFKIANYWWVILSILIGISSHLMRAVRWKMLLEPMGYTPSTWSTFLAVMVGYFTNLGIPRSGEVARCSVLYKEARIPVDKSFGTVIVERSIDMLIFFSLFFITITSQYSYLDNYVQKQIYPKINEKFDFIPTEHLFGNTALILFAITALVFFAFRKKIFASNFWKKISKLFGGIWEGLISISKIKQPLLFIAYSLGIWVFYYFMIYFCLLSLPETANLGLVVGLSVLVIGSIGIMITPGGIGLYPVLVAETLFLYGITKESGTGIAIGWITWSAQTVMIIIVGAISLLIVSAHSKKNNVALQKDKE